MGPGSAPCSEELSPLYRWEHGGPDRKEAVPKLTQRSAGCSWKHEGLTRMSVRLPLWGRPPSPCQEVDVMVKLHSEVM